MHQPIDRLANLTAMAVFVLLMNMNIRSRRYAATCQMNTFASIFLENSRRF